MLLRYTFVLCLSLSLLLFSSISRLYAETKAENNKRIRVIFSSYTSPYVFENGTGIVVDIVTEALEPSGYQVIPVFLPLGRGFKMFADREIEATSIIKKNSGLKNAYYSDYFMQYHNFAITLKNGPRINNLADLSRLDIIGFQNAHLYLGKSFGDIVADNPNYKELSNQKVQVRMLLSGRTDVAVMDKAIFTYHKNQLISEGAVSKDVQVIFNHLFEPTQYRTAFIDPHIRDDFNKGLKTLRASGRYNEIYNHYIEQYFDIDR